MTRAHSDITLTDMFCGAGGSSIGAHATGVRVRLAMNHWKLAIETHNTNFQDTDHACTDIQACEPRAFYATDILIASPECTNHSLAKGVQRKRSQIDAFASVVSEPEAIRSRATMWDVPRFAEVHRYRAIIVENVPDARHWVMFDAWLQAMHALGYRHRCVFLNSMFAHPTPQSRDRMYVVFWRKGHAAPDLEIRPVAYCERCAVDVESVQSWKPGRDWGRYKRQYLYCCPVCAREVTPYYYAAINAIDWSLPAERIGDRARALKERTLARIRFGLERYGRQPLIVHTRMTSGIGDRVKPAMITAIGTQVGDVSHALCHPFTLNTSHSAADARAQSAAQPLPTQTTSQELGIAVPPSFVMHYRNQEGIGYPARALTAPIATVVSSNQERLIIAPAALVTMRDMQSPRQLVRPLSDAIGTQVATATQDWMVSPAPFLTSFYGQSQASAMDDAVPTVTTLDRHALVEPGPVPDVDDCYFRMLQPHEIGHAMAFPGDYHVLGNKRDQVKQYGNAVTPPVMQLLVDRVVASLTGEDVS
jgi:DNA (cytosine-5)-methyltransferase 1